VLERVKVNLFRGPETAVSYQKKGLDEFAFLRFHLSNQQTIAQDDREIHVEAAPSRDSFLAIFQRQAPGEFVDMLTCHGIFLHLRLASGLREGGAMKRTIRIEEQIIGILQGHEAGAKSADLCRKHGMSEGTCLSLEGEVFCCDPR
jgi:hypothetical protein